MYEADELDSLSLPSSYRRTVCRRTVRLGACSAAARGEYVTKPAWKCVYLGMNASKRPFDDPRVRRALVLAADREAFTDTLFQGQDTPATGGFVPPEMPGHSPASAYRTIPHKPDGFWPRPAIRTAAVFLPWKLSLANLVLPRSTF